jgi:threonine/homoserine/homoserine lactone efflux protein
LTTLTDLPTLFSFLVAAFVICIIPGSAVSAVVSAGLARGFRAGLQTELGVQIGRFCMVVLVAVALELVRSVIAAAFDWIKYAGVIYLIYLGIRFLFTRPTLKVAGDDNRGAFSHIVAGFLVTWTNPKAFLFFGAFLPQFVDTTHPAVPQVIVLGLIEMAIAAVTDSLWLLLGVTAREKLGSTAGRRVNQGAGIILIVAAVWLALQHQA